MEEEKVTTNENSSESPRKRRILLGLGVNICRLVLAATLIFSGFVKAVDPVGTQYKIEDYLAAIGLQGLLTDWLSLIASVALATLEFTLGILILFAIQRRLASRVALLLMAAMTVVSIWLVVANPISDCGCFGDALKLTNGQTLAKNLILLVCAAVTAKWATVMPRIISESSQWIVENFTPLFIIAVSIYCIHYLPLIDFRPYHIDADIRKGMEIPEGAPGAVVEQTFVMEKDGEQREFTIENYPDSTWTFVDRHDKVISPGYVPPIHDFSITDDEGNDLTDQILDDEGFTFLLIAPQLEKASESCFGDIDHIYEYCLEYQHGFICLTASGEKAREEWRDDTGAEYQIATTDETTLKTIIRSNPGLLLLKKGKILGKWSHNNMPKLANGEDKRIFSSAAPTEYKTQNAKTLVTLLMWFALSLIVLTITDRLWAWSKYIRKKKKQHS